MTVSWSDVQLAIQAGIRTAAVGVTPKAIVWADEPRPAGITVFILEPVYMQHLQDRDTFTANEDNPGGFRWDLSSLYYIRVQIRAESVYNAPGFDALFALENIRAGLANPTLVWGAGVAYQPDISTYVHHTPYPHGGRTVSAYSLECGFRAVLDYPLDQVVEGAPNMQSVVLDETEVEIGEDDPVDLDQEIERPVA